MQFNESTKISLFKTSAYKSVNLKVVHVCRLWMCVEHFLIVDYHVTYIKVIETFHVEVIPDLVKVSDRKLQNLCATGGALQNAKIKRIHFEDIRNVNLHNMWRAQGFHYHG